MKEWSNYLIFVVFASLLVLVPFVSTASFHSDLDLVDSVAIQSFKATVCQIIPPAADCVGETKELLYGGAKLSFNEVYGAVYVPADNTSQQTALQYCEDQFGAGKCILSTNSYSDYFGPSMLIKLSVPAYEYPFPIGFLSFDIALGGAGNVYRSNGGGVRRFTKISTDITVYTCTLVEFLQTSCTSSIQPSSKTGEVGLSNLDFGNRLFEDGSENRNDQFSLKLKFNDNQPEQPLNNSLNFNVANSYISFYTSPTTAEGQPAYSTIVDLNDIGLVPNIVMYGPAVSSGEPLVLPVSNLTTYKFLNITSIGTAVWEPSIT